MLTFDDLTAEQQAGIEFIYDHDETLLLADVGTGKTVMAYTAIQELMEDGHVGRALVVAPKKVCLDAWATEIDVWEHLDRSILRPSVIAGENSNKRQHIIDNPGGVIVCNYENLIWLMTTYPQGLPDVDMIVLDEVDKLKAHNSKRFKGAPRRKGKRLYDGMMRYRERFRLRVGMTGTPRPKHLLNLWAQAYTLDGGAALGDDYHKFKKAHFYQSDWGGFKFEPLPGREQWIYDQIAPFTFRIAKREGDGRPVTRELPVRRLELPPAVRAEYRQLEKEYVVYLQRKKRGEATVVEAENAAVKYGKLKQIAQGLVYDLGEMDPETRKRERLGVVEAHTVKFDALDERISELQGEPYMIVYEYQSQLEWLQKKYPHLEYLGGGLSDKAASDVIARWNANDIELLALHPASAGHGLNLQKGGANHIGMLTLPESAGLFEQVVGRLSRPGNSSAYVYVDLFLMRGTIDEERNLVVHGEIDDQADMLAYMEARQ